MQTILLRIINIEHEATDQLQIAYCAFVKYLRKNGNKVKSASDTHTHTHTHF